MLPVPTHLSMADLFVLDRVFTPIANWAHDVFDIRAYQLARMCALGFAVSIALDINGGIIRFLAGALAGTLVFSEFIKTPPKIGMLNHRRYSEQFLRLIVWVVTYLALLPFSAYNLVWDLSYLSLLYFAAVQDRPRRHRDVRMPAFEGAA